MFVGVAQVAKAFTGSEAAAVPILRSLDVDYVLITFGGVAAYGADDINKFVWMIRIANSAFPGVKEKAYFSDRVRARCKQFRCVFLSCRAFHSCLVLAGRPHCW